MNKKVLTLCASFLLAGGLTSSVLAESFQGITSQINAGTFNEDQYYYVNLDNRANQTVATSNNQLDINATGLWSQEENRSTWWRIQPVETTDINGDKFLIGFKLVSALTGEPLTVTTSDGTKYDTFLKNSSTHLVFAKADGTSAGKYFKGSLTDVGSSIADGQSYSYSLEEIKPQELAYDLHHFYNFARVLTDDVELSKMRLLIIYAVKVILAQAFNLIRIEAPDRM